MLSRSEVHLPPRFEHECSVCERKANFSEPYAHGARDDVWPGVHDYSLQQATVIFDKVILREQFPTMRVSRHLCTSVRDVHPISINRANFNSVTSTNYRVMALPLGTRNYAINL